MATRDRNRWLPRRRPTAIALRLGRAPAAALALAAAGLLAPIATAQVALEDYVARSLARTTLLDLRMQPEVGPDEYEIAALLLAEARRWSPDDEILLRKEIDARWSAGDEQQALALTRELLRMDLLDGKLDDEISMLRVLSADISRIQTVEGRLEQYEALLGRSALPAPIRSRLALDAALLLREHGDVEGFASMLARATALDSTHKQAATLAATYYAAHSDDPVGRLEALLNVLLADPVDLNVHLSLSRTLSSHGAYEAAMAFHRAAMALASAGGQSPPENIELEMYLLRWLVWGPKGLGTEMEQPLVEQRGMIAQTVIRRQRLGQPVDDLPTPEQILPSLENARLRVLIAAADGDQSGATRAVRDLGGAINRQVRELVGRTEDPTERAQIGLYTRQIVLELQALRLITGVQLERAAEDLAKLDDELNGQEPPAWMAAVRPEELEYVRDMLRAVTALYRVQQGEWDALEDAWALRDMGQLARIVLAECQVALGLTEAATTFSAALQQQRLSIWTAWAHHRLLEIAPDMAAPPQTARELAKVARATPDWIWRSVTNPSRYMTLMLEAEQVEGPLEGGMVRLRLRNESPAPMAMGPDQPINTRFMLAPKLEIGPRNAARFAVPEIVNVDRRLRLNPRESIEVELWAGAGVAGWFLESSGTSTSRIRWRALQGFRVTPAGAYMPGPLCLSAETALIRRDIVRETQLSARELGTRLGTDGEQALAVTCLAVRSLYVGPDAREIPEDLARELVRVAAERYPTLSASGRMAMLLGLPNATMNPSLAEFDAAAERETDPRVLAAVLLTRVSDPSSPALARARESDDEGLKRLAELLAARLATDAPGYARFERLPTANPLRGDRGG